MPKLTTKQKISITLDKSILDSIENLSDNLLFRNRSHLIEYCINKFLEDKNE